MTIRRTFSARSTSVGFAMSNPPNNHSNRTIPTKFVKSAVGGQLTGALGSRLAAALGRDAESVAKDALCEVLRGDPNDPKVRSTLRRLWKTQAGQNPKSQRLEQWDTWW